jgi:hypothetical protein
MHEEVEVYLHHSSLGTKWNERTLGGPHSLTGLYEEGKHLFRLTRLGSQFFGRPARSVFTTLTDLSYSNEIYCYV